MLLSHQEALKIEKLLACDNGATSVHSLTEGLVACSNLKRALDALHYGNDSEEGPAKPLVPKCIESLEQVTYLLTSVASSALSPFAKKGASHCLPSLAEALAGHKSACNSCLHHVARAALKGNEELLDACRVILTNGGLSSDLLVQHLLPELGALWKSCTGDAAISLHVIGMILAAVNFISDKTDEDNCNSVANIHSLERTLASTPPLVAVWGRQNLGNDAVAAWLRLVSVCIPLTCDDAIRYALVRCAVECAVAFGFVCPFVGLGLGADSSCELITEDAVRLDATQTAVLLALRWGGDLGRLFLATDAAAAAGGVEEQFVHCFSSEDDRLLEALWLALKLYKPGMPLHRDSGFSKYLRPPVLLMELLKIIAYDESVLLDWIISPETSLFALQYFLEVSSYLVLQKEGVPLNKGTQCVLIRLCDQIQKLQRSQVFPFNATPLITCLLATTAHAECE